MRSMLTVGVVSLDTKNSAALLAMLQQTGLVQPIAQWDLMAGEGFRKVSGSCGKGGCFGGESNRTMCGVTMTSNSS